MAAQFGSVDLVKELISLGVAVNVPLSSVKSFFSPFFRSILFQDSRDCPGLTPLHAACAMGSVECVRELVKGGADLEAALQNDAV